MSTVTDSILLSIKKLNNVPADYTAFDDDFILYINSALSDLHQIGIGPQQGFQILDENDLWDDFVEEEPRLNQIKTFIGLRVRLFFDPPASSFAIGMMEKQLEEQLYRLKLAQDDINAEEAG
jgi:hypothetical protein